MKTIMQEYRESTVDTWKETKSPEEKLQDELKQLRAENAALKEALGFYAELFELCKIYRISPNELLRWKEKPQQDAKAEDGKCGGKCTKTQK